MQRDQDFIAQYEKHDDWNEKERADDLAAVEKYTTRFEFLGAKALTY